MSWTDQLTQFVRDYVDSTGDSNVERAVSFYAPTESAARREWSRGKVAVTLEVTIQGGIPEITSLKQRTLERQQGVLSTYRR